MLTTNGENRQEVPKNMPKSRKGIKLRRKLALKFFYISVNSSYNFTYEFNFVVISEAALTLYIKACVDWDVMWGLRPHSFIDAKWALIVTKSIHKWWKTTIEWVPISIFVLVLHTSTLCISQLSVPELFIVSPYSKRLRSCFVSIKVSLFQQKKT